MNFINTILVLSLALTACVPLGGDVVSNRNSKKKNASMNISSSLNWDGDNDLASPSIEIE